MLLNHLAMAWKVLLRRKFFTLLSLVGIGATLMSLLMAVALYDSLPDSRAAGLQTALAPIVAVGLMCAFLLLNVALGLFGALWQAIGQRRAEIGLRRAVGATGPGISRQFLAETLVLTSLAVGPGLLLAAQFPLLGAFGVPAAVYGVGMALAAALVYGFAAVCAVQPSWQAARIRPAVALREE